MKRMQVLFCCAYRKVPVLSVSIARIPFLVIGFMLLLLQNSTAQPVGGLYVMSSEVVYPKHNNLFQDIVYRSENKFSASIRIATYRYGDSDSTLLYDLQFDDVPIKKGLKTISLKFEDNSRRHFADYGFLDVIKKFGLVPPGNYTSYVRIVGETSGQIASRKFYWVVDSTLAYKSKIRENLKGLLASKNQLKKASDLQASVKRRKSSNKEIQQANNSLGKKLSSRYGVNSISEHRGDKDYVALYYKEWFLGRYEVGSKNEMLGAVKKEEEALKGNFSSLIDVDPLGKNSISKQVRVLDKKEDKKKQINGQIDLLSNFSTGKETGSQQDNNFQEIYGDIGARVLGLPVRIEGFYTTQDANRKAKASYIRLKYDIDEAKSELNENIGVYRERFQQVSGLKEGINSSYGSYLNQLKSQKAALLREIGTEDIASKPGLNLDTAPLVNRAAGEAGKADSSGKVASNKAKLSEKYRKLEALERKIEKYSALLQQYNDQVLVDSIQNYSRLQELDKKGDISYKDMAKAATGLLPDSKVSRFIAGLTKLDVGILNQYESKYTAAGQNLTGLNVGYDWGICKTSFSAGKTQYISREGDVEKYSTYMGRLDMKPAKGQEVSLIYYGYSPLKQLLKSNNFIKEDIAIPSFAGPAHIVSVAYKGKISRDLEIDHESAASFRQGDPDKKIEKGNAATNTAVAYSIGRLGASVKAEWEYVGKEFENQALPYIRSATERYTLGTQASFFRSFLNVGVQYNYLKQSAFSSTGYNVRWGFDVKTVSKRYPCFSLSYKPFSTFRNYTDTLAIAQKPMYGEVWIGRATYQIKRKDINHRFFLMFNRNSSNIDTQSYSTTTVQGGYVLMNKKTSFNATAGYSVLPFYDSSGSTRNQSSVFCSLGITRNLSKAVSVNFAEDIAFGSSGLQKNATTAGCEYRLPKKPLALRLMIRYNNYKEVSAIEQQNIFMGQLGLNWQFKTNY